MGILQLAGAVSGFGKGLQQGVENMQQYMHASLLLKEREQLELARQQLTFAHDRGMLREKAIVDGAQMRERAALDHENALERLEAQQDETARQARIGRQFEREQDAEKDARAIAAETRALEAEKAKASAKEQEKIREEQREYIRKRKERQEEGGFKIVEETIKNQRPTAAVPQDGKWSDQTKATARAIEGEIAEIKEQLYGLARAPEKEHPALKQRLAELIREQNVLLGRGASAGASSPKANIGALDTFLEKSPLSGPASTRTPAKPTATPPPPSNLPRHGNTEPALSDLLAFERDYEAANRKDGNTSAVVEAFKDKFGRIPTQKDWDRISNARR